MANLASRSLVGFAIARVVAGKCPGSNSLVHASCEVKVSTQAPCSDVMVEMEARVLGTSNGEWKDPHNGGIYAVLKREELELDLQRTTGNKKYTDKLTFTFASSSNGGCIVNGCSESQVFSVMDFSTNYCNMRNLYCGSQEGCTPLRHDFAMSEYDVVPSLGAGHDPKACIVAPVGLGHFLDHKREELQSAVTCPPADFSTVKDFDLKSFIKARWFVQQQMPVKYLPASQNRCVYAEYKLFPKKTFWGYDVSVHNHAEDVAPPHKVHDSGSRLCAKVVDEKLGKLAVAPCFLPRSNAGPYWVLDYNEEQGYALISGGAPTVSTPGGCSTHDGVNNAGLWIFTRSQQRDESLVAKVRQIAAAKGFDLSVLADIDQTECNAQKLVEV